MNSHLAGAVLAAAFLAVTPAGSAGREAGSGDAGLDAFRAWLERERPGYGCDEGPAPLRNESVAAAYPGRRFYYVLTHARGIQPPFPNAVSLVAAVDDSGHVAPLRPSVEGYRGGLVRVRTASEAKRAATAVLVLASCGGRRWAYTPDRLEVKKSRKGWKCTYRYDGFNSSWVSFDSKGVLTEIGGSSPPVP